MTIRVTVGIKPDGNGYYVFCPAFPEIMIGTMTPEEGEALIPDAVVLAIEQRLIEGKPLPVGPCFSFAMERDEVESKPTLFDEEYRSLELHGDLSLSLESA